MTHEISTLTGFYSKVLILELTYGQYSFSAMFENTFCFLFVFTI